MPPLTYGTSNARVTISDDFSGYIRQAIERTMPGMYAKVEEATKRVHAQAVERAPVKTGRFQRSIEMDMLLSPDFEYIRGRVFSDVKYGKYITSASLPDSGNAFVELFQKPMRAEGKALILPLADALRKALGVAGG